MFFLQNLHGVFGLLEGFSLVYSLVERLNKFMTADYQ